MSVTIISKDGNKKVTLNRMDAGQAFMDGDGDILIRTDKRADRQEELILVMQLDTGEVFKFDEDIEFQPVSVEAKIVT